MRALRLEVFWNLLHFSLGISFLWTMFAIIIMLRLLLVSKVPVLILLIHILSLVSKTAKISVMIPGFYVRAVSNRFIVIMITKPLISLEALVEVGLLPVATGLFCMLEALLGFGMIRLHTAFLPVLGSGLDAHADLELVDYQFALLVDVKAVEKVLSHAVAQRKPELRKFADCDDEIQDYLLFHFRDDAVGFVVDVDHLTEEFVDFAGNFQEFYC